MLAAHGKSSREYFTAPFKEMCRHSHGSVKRYLIRITKGLLFNFYPKFDYSISAFEVTQLVWNEEVEQSLRGLFYDERGDRSFDLGDA